jgi:putative hydrolase of the HAD superfamily
MQNPEWLFFDLGSTLIDETAAYARRIRETVDGSPVTVPEFEAAFKNFSAQGFDGYAAAAAQFGLSKAPWHSEEEFPYADAEAVLGALKRRGYRLGVIANQQPGMEARLRRWNLLRFFDVIAASADVGAAKPDPSIFLWALRHADCAPQNAVMIGDRIDNDILPAKALGMKTVRILSGPSAAYRPANDPADRTIPSLPDLLLMF